MLRSPGSPLAILVIAAMAIAGLVARPEAAAVAQPSPQAGGFTETFNGDVGRRAAEGRHPASGSLRWTNPLPAPSAFSGPQGQSGLLLDHAGHLLVPTYRDDRLDQITALDRVAGTLAWRSATGVGEGGVYPGCATVADDGTIWTITQGDFVAPKALVALDPSTGIEDPSRRISLPDDFALGCTAGLHLLPGNRVATLNPTFSELHVFDLSRGEQLWSWAPEPHTTLGDVLLVGGGGERLFVVSDRDVDGPDLDLVAVGASSGTEVGRVALPGSAAPLHGMTSAFIDVDGGVVLTTSEGFSGSEDGHVVRVDTAGMTVDWQVQAFASSTGDPFGQAPRQLLPGGADSRSVVAIDGADESLVALGLADGGVEWTAARPGIQFLLFTESLIDSAGNILLPTNVPNDVDGASMPWSILTPTGATGAAGPDGVFSRVDAFGPLDGDGTVYGVGVVDDATVVFAVTPGVPGGGAVSVSPPTVGAAWSTLQLRGTGVTALDTVTLARGGDRREADVVMRLGSARLATAGLDLTGASPGEWSLTGSGPGGPLDLGTITVEPPDAEKAISLTLLAPDAFRLGTGPQRVTATVRNDGNIDLAGLPVIIGLDGVSPDTEFVPRDVPPSMPIPEDAPDGLSPDDFPLTTVVDGQILFPALIPVLGPGQSAAITLDMTIPVESATIARGEVFVVVSECLATNNRTVVPWAEDLESFDQLNLAGCITGIANSVFGTGFGQLAGSLQGIGSGQKGAFGCAMNVLFSIPGLVTNGVNREWMPVLRDVGMTVASCAASLGSALIAGSTLLGPVGWVLSGVGLLLTVLRDCGVGEYLGFDFGSSFDPNDITGPTGGGDAHFIRADDSLDYRIRFENLAEAGFPAAQVIVRHTLDPALDPVTFRPGALGWGDVVLTPPGAAAEWTELVPDGGLLVEVSVERTGPAVEWRLRSIDPLTGQPPTDPRAGFLPPNGSPPDGEGFVSFSISPAATVADGDVVRAQASIVFDVNEPIATNVWSNTFDSTPPTSSVAPDADPAASNEVVFVLDGRDDVSGVHHWRTSQAVGEGALQPFDSRFTGDRMTIEAPRGSSVRVQARAVDGAGNVQEPSAEAQASVSVDAIERIAGTSRVETAVAVSQRTYALADTVVLARADTYPDALAGAPLARAVAGPILLTGRSSLPTAVAGELRRLGARQVVVLGGEAAVTSDVLAQLDALGVTTTRVFGASRFETAAEIAGQFESPERVFLVEGAHADPARGWPDALAVAPFAAATGVPILLTEQDRLPAETATALDAIGTDRVTIVGGTAAVSQGVADAVRAGGFTVDRIAGADRYGTSLAVVDAAVGAGAASPSITWLSTGLNFPDALAAGPAVATSGGQMLLVHGTAPAGSAAVLDRVATDAPDLLIARVVGGTAAVGQRVEDAVRARLAENPPVGGQGN